MKSAITTIPQRRLYQAHELRGGFMPALIHQETQARSASVRSVDGSPLALTSLGQSLNPYVQREQTRRRQTATRPKRFAPKAVPAITSVPLERRHILIDTGLREEVSLGQYTLQLLTIAYGHSKQVDRATYSRLTNHLLAHDKHAKPRGFSTGQGPLSPTFSTAGPANRRRFSVQHSTSSGSIPGWPGQFFSKSRNFARALLKISFSFLALDAILLL